jgi:uncharacterized protein
VGYFIISLLASIVGAISGIGGGVIIKPVLDFQSGLPVATISFLSGTTVLSMTIITLVRRRNAEVAVNRKTAGFLALGSIAGGLLGKYLFDYIRSSMGQDSFIAMIQSALLVLLTAFVFFFTLHKEKITPYKRAEISFILLTGFLLGGLSTFLGIGGGPINLAVLYFFFSMDSKTAALNSIYIIFFSQLTNLIFTALSGSFPVFDPLVLSLMIGGGISGGLIGSQLSRKMSHRAVDRLFMAVMIIIIGLCSYNLVKSSREFLSLSL